MSRNDAVVTAGPRAFRVDVIALTILACVAIVPLDTLFDTHNALVLAAGGAVLAAGVNVLLRRASLLASVLVGVVALALYLTFVVFEIGVPDGAALRTVWTETTGSWADLLTAPVPADPAPDLVAFPVLLAWVGTQVGTTLALRTRWITLPVAAPLAALLVALLFSGEQSTPRFAFVAVAVALVLAVVLVRANAEFGPVAADAAPARSDGSPNSELGRVGSAAQFRLGIAVIGVAAVLAAGIGLTVPVTSAADRVDLHDRYQPPFDLSEAVSPLSQLRAGLDDDDQDPLFTVQFAQIPDGVDIDHVDIAVLDTYDGTVWGTDANFGRAGRRLPPDPEEAEGAVVIDQRYDLTDYRDPFLPFLARPVALRATGLGFDRDTGMIVGTPGSRANRSYDVRSLLPIDSDEAKVGAPPGADPDLLALIEPPAGGWPDELSQLAAELTPTASPYEDFVALEADMRSDHYGYNEETRPGHNLKVLVDFLTAPVGADGVETARIGYAEQFASAFAILARIKGYPSRVAVGYRIDPGLAASGEPVEVRPGDITAWPEVHLQGAGWVRFDPTNQVPRTPNDVEKPPPPVLPDDTVTETSLAPENTAGPATGGQGESGAGRGMPIWLLLMLAVVVGGMASIPVAKVLVRRRRRTHGTVADRTRGAWLQTRDLLQSHGFDVSGAETVHEIAKGVDCAAPKLASNLRRFGPLVDHLMYAAAEPTDDMATSAWDIEVEMSEVIAADCGVRTRAIAVFDPRPLAEAVRRR